MHVSKGKQQIGVLPSLDQQMLSFTEPALTNNALQSMDKEANETIELNNFPNSDVLTAKGQTIHDNKPWLKLKPKLVSSKSKHVLQFSESKTTLLLSSLSCLWNLKALTKATEFVSNV